MSIRGDVGYEAVAGIIESDCCQTGLERNQKDQGHNRPLSCARLYRDDPDELRKKEMMRLKKELPKKEYDKLKGAMWALRKKEEKLTDEEKQVPECLFGHSPELKKAYDFYRDLTDIFEDDDISKSEAVRKIRIWKIRVGASGLKCFDGFLKTLGKMVR